MIVNPVLEKDGVRIFTRRQFEQSTGALAGYSYTCWTIDPQASPQEIFDYLGSNEEGIPMVVEILNRFLEQRQSTNVRSLFAKKLPGTTTTDENATRAACLKFVDDNPGCDGVLFSIEQARAYKPGLRGEGDPNEKALKLAMKATKKGAAATQEELNAAIAAMSATIEKMRKAAAVAA